MGKNFTKTAGWPIPDHVKDEFTDFCKRVGSLAKDDCAGALFIWQYLPAHLRERAKLDAQSDRMSEPQEGFWIEWACYLSEAIDRAIMSAMCAFAADPFLREKQEFEEALTDPRSAYERLKFIAAGMSDEAVRSLSPDEQKFVDALRQSVPCGVDEARAPDGRSAEALVRSAEARTRGRGKKAR